MNFDEEIDNKLGVINTRLKRVEEKLENIENKLGNFKNLDDLENIVKQCLKTLEQINTNTIRKKNIIYYIIDFFKKLVCNAWKH